MSDTITDDNAIPNPISKNHFSPSKTTLEYEPTSELYYAAFTNKKINDANKLDGRMNRSLETGPAIDLNVLSPACKEVATVENESDAKGNENIILQKLKVAIATNRLMANKIQWKLK